MTMNEAGQTVPPNPNSENAPAASPSAAPRKKGVWIARLGLLASILGVIPTWGTVSRGLVVPPELGLAAPLGLGLCLAAVNRRLTAAGVLGALLGLGGMISALDMGAKPQPIDTRPQPFEPKLLGAENLLAKVDGWLKLYEAQHGEYPTTAQGWAAIPEAQSAPQDPWGNPLVYERPAPNWCEIRSVGPDGLLKTEDDLPTRIYQPRSTNPATLAFWNQRRSTLIPSAILFFVGLVGGAVVTDRCRACCCASPEQTPPADTP